MPIDTDTVTQLIRTVVAEEVVSRFEKLAHKVISVPATVFVNK